MREFAWVGVITEESTGESTGESHLFNKVFLEFMEQADR